jgi:hypothetical protein
MILRPLVQKRGVISLKSLKKALYPALDLHYHKMILISTEALERGIRYVKEMGLDR